MFCAGQAWHIPVQVVVPAHRSLFCLPGNSYGVFGAWLALHRTTGSADNCAVNFSDVGTTHLSRMLCLRKLSAGLSYCSAD